MFCRTEWRSLTIGLLLGGWLAGGVAQAQPPAPPVPPAAPPVDFDVQELLNGLRSAKQRIEAPEAERSPADGEDDQQVPSTEVPAPSEEAPAPSEEAPAPEEEEEDEEGEEDLADFEDRLDEIEGRLADDFVLDGTDNSTMQIYGRIHLDAWGFPGSSPLNNIIETEDPNLTPQNRFGFRRIRPGFRGQVNDLMLYRLELELAEPNEFEFRDVYLGFEDMFGVRELLIGNQKRPYGLDHLNSSRFNVFIERPFIVEAFNEDARRLGIQAYDWSDDLRYNWRYGSFLLRNIQDEGVYVSDHVQGEIAGRFATTYWWDEWSDGRGYGHFAVSGNWAKPDGTAGGDPDMIGNGRAANEARFRTRGEDRTVERVLDTGRIAGAEWYSILGIEHVVNVGPLQVAGEYMVNTLSRESDPTVPGRGEQLYFHGGYFYVSYFLTGEHMPWDRETGQLDRPQPFENFFLVNRLCGRECGWGDGWGAWQIASRYSYADLSDEDIFGGAGYSITAGLVWYWNQNASVQMNYVWGFIDDRMIEHEDTGTVYRHGGYETIGVRARIDF